MRAFVFSMLVLFVVAIALGDAPPTEEPESAEKSTSFWMEKKMEYAQSMLRGLASADYAAIGENARQLRLLSKVEGFVRRRNASYRSQLNTFERVCEDMMVQADKENLAGVTLAFNQLTVSCVSCHQLLRTPNAVDTVNPNLGSKSDGKGETDD